MENEVPLIGENAALKHYFFCKTEHYLARSVLLK
jgi:hypothetical protein